MRNPFRYFNSSPEVIRLTVMMYVRYPLSLRQVEDLLFERGMARCGSRRRGPRGVCHEAAGSQGARRFLKRALKRAMASQAPSTDLLRSDGAALKVIGILGRCRESARW